VQRFFQLVKICAARHRAMQRSAQALCAGSGTGEQTTKDLSQIGIGIEDGKDGGRSDGEKGKGVPGASGHDDLLQIACSEV
jgi:hypothetical protein